MKKILGIQFRINKEAIAREQVSLRRELGLDVSLECLDALDATTTWDNPEALLQGFSGVVLGGSGDLDFDGNRPADDEMRLLSQVVLKRLTPLFQYIFAHDIPTLGICYGHQILGAFAGAKVHSDAVQRKTKSHEVQFIVDKNDYFLFADLPDTFHGHYGHKDVLDRVPEGAVLLMQGGEHCQVSALQYKNNIYTVQFHPELTFTEVVDRIKTSPGYLPEGVMAEEIFKDDPSSNVILRNFGKLVQQESKS
jgi:GMP synthase-like glutamine amidotransferase